MSRYDVRRRIWAWDPTERRRRAESILDGGLDAVVFGPVSAAIWHGIILAVETVAMVFLTVGQALARVVARQAWPVEARFRTNGAVYRQWLVQGFRAAGRAADELQALADAGRMPPPGRFTPRD